MTVAAALLLAVVPVLWQDPGDPAQADMSRPARGVALPVPPFQFLREDLSGNSAKVAIRDAAGLEWQVKGGPEGRSESFTTRIVSALGYYADAVCFLKEGRIENVRGPLKRASGFIKPDGSFTYAAFELRDPTQRYLMGRDWTWVDNPFAGTRELKGLKILAMLFSDWDNKDRRDRRQGSNTGIMQSMQRPVRETYFINDWGQALGAWGRFGGRSTWTCRDYTRQTPMFITGVYDDRIAFGYEGQHTADFSHDIAPSDAAWLLRYLGRITPAQVRTALSHSGASPEEEECFSRPLLQRIEMLRNAAAGNAVQQ
jgi:hypothetical protein